MMVSNVSANMDTITIHKDNNVAVAINPVANALDPPEINAVVVQMLVSNSFLESVEGASHVLGARIETQLFVNDVLPLVRAALQ